MIGFTPGEAVKGETYNVTIQGVIENATSTRFDHSYTVTFFDLME